MKTKNKAKDVNPNVALKERLLSEVDELLQRDDYDAETSKKIDQINSKLDMVCARLAREDEDKSDDDDSEKEDEGEENSFRAVAPAVVRSRGRVSAENIHDHAKIEGFSLTRGALAIQSGKQLRGIELEVNQELTRTSGGTSQPNALLIPFDYSKLNQRGLSRRDLTTSSGAGAIPVYTEGAQLIEWLYPRLIGPQLGVSYMPGLKSGTKLPRTSAVFTVAAVAEQGSASGSTPSLDDIQLNPHVLTTNVTISKLFATQSAVAADEYVYKNGGSQMAVTMDQWLISGLGSSNQPAGLLNNSAFTQVVQASTNTLTYSNTLSLEKLIAKANANFGPNQRYLTSPSGYAQLQQTPKIGSTYPTFIISDDGKINGKDVVNSSQISDNLTFSGTSGLTSLIYGNWDYCVFAMFGESNMNSVEVIVDPYTGSTAGNLSISFFMLADTNLTRPAAFAAIENVAYSS